MRLALLCVSFLFASGCYLTHDGSGGRPCGSRLCDEGQVCCMGCAGDEGFCLTADLPCPDVMCVDRCVTSSECAPEEFCDSSSTTCGGFGRCVPRPVACERDCPGVCGCDILNYCNECDANRAGQTMAWPGSCGGETCDRMACPVGTVCCPLCFGDQVCAPEGEGCPDVFCPADCALNEECAPSELCQFAPGECGPGRGPGTCAPRPEGCTADCPGVCGCDGDTYCNECVANAAGVNLDIAGACRPPVCGRGGRECGGAEYCDLGPLCGGADGQSCQPFPSGCDDDVDPVCGCDGRTYSNACEAASAGITVRERGECPMARTCVDLRRGWPDAESGVYTLAPNSEWVSVYCDFETDGGGWMLIASTAGEPLDDAAGPYHENMATLTPASRYPFVWNGMRPIVFSRSDVRFTCRERGEPNNRVDLSFYDVPWYLEWTTGTDAESCFADSDGRGFERPAPARRDNISGVSLPLGSEYAAGFLEGEDECADTGDFTVDFQDRGMDGDEGDGTDWGEDDNSPKCGFGPLSDGIWQIWLREL